MKEIIIHHYQKMCNEYLIELVYDDGSSKLDLVDYFPNFASHLGYEEFFKFVFSVMDFSQWIGNINGCIVYLGSKKNRYYEPGKCMWTFDDTSLL